LIGREQPNIPVTEPGTIVDDLNLEEVKQHAD
ncbi:MAG: hypothetical protein QOG92_993, partial [Verrucomicrobiota bacterium]|nr:hypothetical protein [Verrucomicrobiota bacterium]